MIDPKVLRLGTTGSLDPARLAEEFAAPWLCFKTYGWIIGYHHTYHIYIYMCGCISCMLYIYALKFHFIIKSNKMLILIIIMLYHIIWYQYI